MRYMVMECHPGFAVVLDEDGRFLKVANRHYKVGQTVTEVIEMQNPVSAPQKRKIKRWAYTLAAAAACMVLAVTSVLRMGQGTYASVYMTINPEVRIDVNRNDTVVGLEGINSDGEELIEGYRYKKKDLNQVMDELVDRAIDMGYLYEGGQISLMLDAESDEWIVTYSDALTSHLYEYLKEKLSVTIEVTDKNTQSNQVIIPVAPEESTYGESDYGEEESAVQPSLNPAPDTMSGDSGYDDMQTDYEEQGDISSGSQPDDSEADGQSDYENQSEYDLDDSDDDSDDDDSGDDDSDDDD